MEGLVQAMEQMQFQRLPCIFYILICLTWPNYLFTAFLWELIHFYPKKLEFSEFSAWWYFLWMGLFFGLKLKFWDVSQQQTEVPEQIFALFFLFH